MPACFLQVKLLEIFSQFGLVYEVQVIDSSDSSEGNFIFLFYFSNFSSLFYSQNFGHCTLVPEVFLYFSPHEDREAARRERKTSGYLGRESHFHADANCQTRQIYNYKRDQ